MRQDDPGVARVALAVADGAAVDWERLESSADSDRSLVRQLRLIAARRLEARPRPSGSGLREPLSAWLRIVLVLAGLKAMLGAAALLLRPEASQGAAVPAAAHLVNLLAFSASGLVLLYAGERDGRALRLGAFFMVTAAAFCNRLLLGLRDLQPGRSEPLVDLLRSLQPEAFSAACFWLFVMRFPDAASFAAPQRIARRMAAVSAAFGGALFLANAALPWLEPGGALAGALAPLDRSRGFGDGFWLVSFALTLPGLPVALWKARGAPLAERRRVVLFAAGVAVGLLPMLVVSLLAIPQTPLRDWVYLNRWPIGVVLYAFLISIPLTTAYSVLVDRVLDVRLVARKVLRYALARGSLWALVLLPLAALAAGVYARRRETLEAVLSDPRSVGLALLGGLGLLLLAVRGRVLARLERAFFRDQVEPGLGLARLAGALRDCRGRREIAQALLDEARAALRPTHAGVFLLSAAELRYLPATDSGRPLPAESALAQLLGVDREPLQLEPERPRGLAPLLPQEDQDWLTDGGFQLLLPIPGDDPAPAGFLALGEKRSELPYAPDELLLLKGLVAAAAVALAPWLRRGEAGDAAALWDEEPAGECGRCGRVSASDAAACACGGELRPAALPHRLLGKFELERRLGAGGMGVVYAATDLDLGRALALKTLPRVSSEAAARLRREARAMASVSHPNVATIYGVYSWQGVPLLAVELLAGGTLRERLAAGPLPPREALELGAVLARALDQLHGAGLLHRDVKPSNVGFAADGRPKLLDLGLARLIEALPADSGEDAGLAGTPLYLPPEAFEGAAPDPHFDLWALNLLLYEAVCGANPFRRPGLEETLDAIASAPAPDPRERAPECPEPVARLLVAGLSKARRDRPCTSAGRLATELESLLSA